MHKPSGSLIWSPQAVELYDFADRDMVPYDGSGIWLELIGKPVLGLAVRDYLIVHPEEIPQAWQLEGMIHFWATVLAPSRRYRINDMVRMVYRIPCSEEFAVPTLIWHGEDHGGWGAGIMPLSHEFKYFGPAAMQKAA